MKMKRKTTPSFHALTKPGKSKPGALTSFIRLILTKCPTCNFFNLIWVFVLFPIRFYYRITNYYGHLYSFFNKGSSFIGEEKENESYGLSHFIFLKKEIANRSFDLRTFGLWAQRASAAPIRSFSLFVCFGLKRATPLLTPSRPQKPQQNTGIIRKDIPRGTRSSMVFLSFFNRTLRGNYDIWILTI